MGKSSSSFYTDRPIGATSTPEEDTSACWEYVEPDEELPRMEEEMPLSDAWRDIPQPIKTLWQQCRNGQGQLTRGKEFYLQALQMASYTDSEDIVPFTCYFPTYADMSVAQLRSYFTVRALIRKGKYPEAPPLSYLFVYIYETLMQVGVGSAAEGWDVLDELRFAYGKEQPKLMRYLVPWMQDYTVYYDVQEKIAETFPQESSAAGLANYATLNDSALFDAATAYSAYNIRRSMLYKKYPEEVVAIVARIIRQAIPFYEKRFHLTTQELCFGRRRSDYHPMFASAVFYNPTPVQEKSVTISPEKCYLCKGGLWTVESGEGSLFSQQRNLLGDLMREADCRLRTFLKIRSKMTSLLQDEQLGKLVGTVIGQYFQEKEEQQHPPVQVDLSRLEKIRSDANAVRDALLTDEEKEAVAEKSIAQPKTVPEVADSPSGSSLFTPEEQHFLRLLLAGGDWQSYLRTIRVPAGVMAETINEKMMDELQDIVLADEGEGLTVIDDYRQELERKL